MTNLTDTFGTLAASYHLDTWGNFRFPEEIDQSANRFAFTGYLFDAETDFYYANARYYQPEYGRFLTQDSFLGKFDEPPSLHRYLYANANPLRFTDPTGNYSWEEFKSDAKWTGDFVVAFGSDLAQNAPERVVKVIEATGRNALHMAAETTLNIRDAGLLTAELAARKVGVDFEADLMSTTALSTAERFAAGESATDITQEIATDTALNVATFGVYGTAKEQYGALRDYAEGRGTIEDVESRLIDAAGASVLNVGLTSGFMNATTGTSWGPNIPGLKNVPGPEVVVESFTQLGGRARAAMSRRVDAALGRSAPSRGAQFRAQYGQRFGEYMRHRGQGYSPRAAQRLSQPYKGSGHHFIQQGPINRLVRTLGKDTVAGRALTLLRDSPLNVRSPRNMTQGRFYEFHARMHGGRSFGRRTAQGNRLFPDEPWKATNVSPPLRLVGPAGYIWYGSPDAALIGAAAVGTGSAAELRSLSQR